MKKIGLLIILALIVYSLFLFFTQPQIASGKPVVAATIFPIADIVRQIAGDQIEVIQIIPSGGSEHFFELTPSLAAQLSKVDSIFYIGYGLDDWIKGVNDNAKYIQVSDGITILPFHNGRDEERDPHYYLSYENAKLIGRNVFKALIVNYGGLDRQKMESNLTRWLQQADSAYLSAQSEIGNLPAEEKKILVFHDAFSYLAKELGLSIAGSYETITGKEPTAQELTQIQKIIIDNQLKVIYSEEQLSSAGLQSLISDLGLRVRNLDPVGGVGERDSVINLLNYNVSQISQ